MAMASLNRPLRIALATVAIALATMAMRVNTASADQCSDYTPGRSCTAMEQYGYCLNNAIDSYHDCAADASFLGKAGCLVSYEVDYYACAAGLPISLFK
jgi:hypothetical protein